MSNFIYNNAENLRTTLGDVHYTPVTHKTTGMCFFAVVDCEDKSTGAWNHSKQYCGIVMEMDNAEEIRNVMHNGSSTDSLKDWFSSQ